MRIIDCQTNIGISPHGPIGDLAYYIKMAVQMGVTDALLFPTPTFARGSCTKALWKVGNDREIKFIDAGKNGQEEESDRNPYFADNLEIIATASDVNNKGEGIIFYPVWKIHPALDNSEDVDRLLAARRVYALKVHGIATATYPEKLPNWLPRLALKHNLPIVFHTDFFRGTPQTYLEYLYQKNNPLDYVKWGNKNKVKTVINHGARLDRKAVNQIKQSDNTMIVYGPDCHIESTGRTSVKTTDYTTDLFRMTPAEKVMFSSDYPWNRDNIADENTERWDSVKRVKGLLSQRDSEKVLFENAADFFRIDK
ncbi:MAG: amidohydrolase family protein [Candidatus Gracilibacteria bacterium]